MANSVLNIDVANIVNGAYLMMGNTDLVSWEDGNKSMEKLNFGKGMFQGCTALKTFSDNMANLNCGDYMFYNCTALETFDSDLSRLENGYRMFYNCTKLNSFDSDLPALTNGTLMFSNCISLSAFNSNLSNLNDGTAMFCYTSLESFSNDLSNLENGYEMFSGCVTLTSFSGDLSNLVNGDYMFYNCTALNSFNSDLSNLSNGENMFFRCSALNSFNIYQNDLNKLENGHGMFAECTSLTSFNSNMNNLSNGENMFCDCTNLTTFGSYLNNLNDGRGMFSRCTNLGSFNDYGSLSRIGNCFCMFSDIKYLYSVIANLESLEDGNSMFVNAGSRLFTDYKYEMSNRGLTDDGEPNCESAVYFQIGSLSSLKSGYMMFASTKTYDYGSENSPYQFSPFALCILNRPSEMNPIHFEGENNMSYGANCMFDGRLVVGSKTLECIHDIMYYNTSPSQQYFGRIGIGTSINSQTPCIQYLKNNFTYLSSSPSDSRFERWYTTNMIGNTMYIDVLFNQ